jgi:flagellin-like protein
MYKQNRAATPVIATILMVAIVVVLAATISVLFLGVTEDVNEPAPNVADTTGEFEPGLTSRLSALHT